MDGWRGPHEAKEIQGEINSHFGSSLIFANKHTSIHSIV